MATKFERAMELLSDAEEDARKSAVQDIISDLTQFAPEAGDAERPGWLEAIQFIKANYIH